MMKKNIKKLLKGIFFSLFAFPATSQVYSKMQMIPADHWIYDALTTLNRENCMVDILDSAPLSVLELENNFLHIDYDMLSEAGKELYAEVEQFFSGKKSIVDFKPIKFSFNVILYPEFLYKSNNEIDWTFATDFTGKKSWDYEKGEYVENAYGAGSNYAGNRLTTPFAKFPLYLAFSDYAFIESDFFIGKSFWGFSKNNNFTNIVYSGEDLDFLWPTYAYGSFGYLFENGFGFDFQAGKQGLQFGRSLTGSVIYNHTFETDFYSKLNLYSRHFRYNLDVVQVNTESFMYLHSFDFVPFNWLKLGCIEGVFLNEPFELRFINPFMVFHSFAAWTQYGNEKEKKYYAETHTCAYLGITFDIVPCKNLRIYGLFAQTEIQPPNELSDPNGYGQTIPNGMGFQLGESYSLPLKKGYLSFDTELFYNSPYLYIKQSGDWSLVKAKFDNMSNVNVPVYSWIGSPFGSDSAGGKLEISYKDGRKFTAKTGYLFTAHGENSFGMFLNTYKNEDGSWSAFFPSVLHLLGIISHDEAENLARNMGLTGVIQYTNQIELSGSYKLNEHFSFDAGFIYSFIFNNKNKTGSFAHGVQLSTACEIRLF